MLLQPPERILVLAKSSYIGDSIVATPFLAQLREHCPAARIDLLTGPQQAQVLAGCPDVDQFIELPHAERRHPGTLWRLARQLRSGRYQVAFMVDRSQRSAWTALVTGIRHRIGLRSDYRTPLLTRKVRWNRQQPEIECYLDLLRAVGWQASYRMPRLWLTDAERAGVLPLLPPGDGPLVAMHPGSHDPLRRNWPADRYTEVGRRLAAQLGARLILCGSPAERADCEQVAAGLAQQPTILAGVTSFRETMAVLSHTALWVGNDGGMLHTAAAVGQATVGIFGPTMALRWGYDQPGHRTVVHRDTRREGSEAEWVRACLDAIEVEQVWETVERVWAERAAAF